MVRVVAGGAEVKQHKWKQEVDQEKQHVRDTIIKCEEEEVDIATQITFLEKMLEQQKQALIDKRKESDEHRHNLIHFDSKRYIELGCRGFPKDSLEFTIFHGMEMKGMEGKRNRLEVKGVTVVPRGFKMTHMFEFDYEPKEEDISMELPTHETLKLSINVPQDFKEWHNKEKE